MNTKADEKVCKKYIELNAREHIVQLLDKEYQKTHSGDTLSALYFALKKSRSNKASFEKLINSISATHLKRICDFARSIGDTDFADLVTETESALWQNALN